jgi:carbon-monoxide dehydrogenase small subunit
MKIKLTINGEEKIVYLEPNEILLHVLREKLGITSPKEGCGTGDCGACTVVVNGKAVNSCLILAVEVDGASILTVEGLSQDEKLHPLQQSFVEEHAVQCGYCTSGMLMTALSYLEENPSPTEEEIRKAIAGNLCRCGAYPFIINAIKKAAETIKRSR